MYIFLKQASAYGVLTFDIGPVPVGQLSPADIQAFSNSCSRFVDFAVAARGRSPASRHCSHSTTICPVVYETAAEIR